MNLDTCPKCVVDELKKVDNYDDYPFISKGGCSYRRFLPAEWVKSEEPKEILMYFPEKLMYLQIVV